MSASRALRKEKNASSRLVHRTRCEVLSLRSAGAQHKQPSSQRGPTLSRQGQVARKKRYGARVGNGRQNTRPRVYFVRKGLTDPGTRDCNTPLLTLPGLVLPAHHQHMSNRTTAVLLGYSPQVSLASGVRRASGQRRCRQPGKRWPPTVPRDSGFASCAVPNRTHGTPTCSQDHDSTFTRLSYV